MANKRSFNYRGMKYELQDNEELLGTKCPKRLGSNPVSTVDTMKEVRSMPLEKKNYHKILTEDQINIISCYLRFHSRQEEMSRLFEELIRTSPHLFQPDIVFRGISSDDGYIDRISKGIIDDQKKFLWVSWSRSIDTASRFASMGKTPGFCVIGKVVGFDVARFQNEYDLSDSALCNYWDGEGEVIAPYPSINVLHLLKFERMF